MNTGNGEKKAHKCRQSIQTSAPTGRCRRGRNERVGSEDVRKAKPRETHRKRASVRKDWVRKGRGKR